LVTGIGDDCAVLSIPAGHELLVTTDFTIEKIHFRRDWHGPALVGRRCLTRGLSDIAAMGGDPRAAFLSLAVSNDVPQKWVDGFLKGLLELAEEYEVPLAGGDTAESAAGIQADIAVVGSVPKGTAVLRSGAKAGEQIFVTGELGGAAAALERMAAGSALGAEWSRYLHPRARVAVGQWLRQRGVASAMRRAWAGRGEKRVAQELALDGGEDYELLFTSGASVPAKVAGVQVTRIGRTTKSLGMRLIGAEGKTRRLDAGGWEHFKGVR
jgi:thiamine-monophosphate kinase